MRDESEWTVEFLNSRPSERSSKSPSSHDSMRDELEVSEAMRAAKERLWAAMLEVERGAIWQSGCVCWCLREQDLRVSCKRWLGGVGRLWGLPEPAGHRRRSKRGGQGRRAPWPARCVRHACRVLMLPRMTLDDQLTVDGPWQKQNQLLDADGRRAEATKGGSSVHV